MAEIQVTWDELIYQLKARIKRIENYNLLFVALPLRSAHVNASKLCKQLEGEYIDFDRELIDRLEKDNWEEHINLVQHENMIPGRIIAEKLVGDVVQELNPSRPIVLGNPNLAIFFNLDLGAFIYPHTRTGNCIFAAPGSVRGQTLLLHGLHPQTGAGFTPIWELVKN